MAVIRVEKNKNYTVMSNVHLRDKELSLKAKGLLSLLLSLPDNWKHSVNGLAAISKEGKAGINSGLQELEKAGYLVRRQQRGEHGKMAQVEYVLIQILEEDYLYEQLYDGLKMEGALEEITILLLKASFIASSKFSKL